MVCPRLVIPCVLHAPEEGGPNRDSHERPCYPTKFLALGGDPLPSLLLWWSWHGSPDSLQGFIGAFGCSYLEKVGLPENLTPSIAVVHWDRGEVDVFVEVKGMYYRNYKVRECNVVAFASTYKEKEVFSGEVEGVKLKRCNKEIRFREPGEFEYSTNSWARVGLIDETEVPSYEYEDDPLFIEIIGGALFGLLCCLYDSPSQRNVHMDYSLASPHQQQLVARISSRKYLSPSPHRPFSYNSHFSVFAFNPAPWIMEDILIG
ncbi:hypothetical protein GOP47_0018844 [Adiantum capillus-veneris]|uniref:Uncharacterized protein n=1 Tax=Adiantum capillus-veneris TaxID=13818 RepID=A0A9D4ZA11_ADICA|nr:hypothetical protein GOP47_0018844 [Adiantum capillus-veneris]